ncbi:MAG: sulfite exporter TauE/SafE family protein [Nanoarchaeota archaeon]|nr:sulfite exporter TauE/SafE family protein [Nanoarchaeota archaeon]
MDLTLSLILLIVLSGFIKGFTGFGMSIILISVLFEVGFKPYEFLPIIVPIFVVLDIILYFENRKNITLDFKENFTLHPTTLMTLFLGILLGTYLLTIIDATYLKISFAVLVLIILFFLIEKVDIYQMKIPSERENGFFGFGAGILTGLLTMNAVPTTLYLMYHQYPKEKYMGNLVTFMIFSDIILVAVYLFKELFVVEYLTTSLIFLLITIVGFFIGAYLRRFVPTKHFKSIVILVLAINSLKIIFETLF